MIYVLFLFHVYESYPDTWAPFRVEKHRSYQSCVKKGDYYVERFYRSLKRVTYNCMPIKINKGEV